MHILFIENVWYFWWFLFLWIICRQHQWHLLCLPAIRSLSGKHKIWSKRVRNELSRLQFIHNIWHRNHPVARWRYSTSNEWSELPIIAIISCVVCRALYFLLKPWPWEGCWNCLWITLLSLPKAEQWWLYWSFILVLFWYISPPLMVFISSAISVACTVKPFDWMESKQISCTILITGILLFMLVNGIEQIQGLLTDHRDATRAAEVNYQRLFTVTHYLKRYWLVYWKADWCSTHFLHHQYMN